MEAMMMKVLVAVVLMLMAVSSVQIASAADAPAPAPAADASIFVPTVFASLVALMFGMLFWINGGPVWIVTGWCCVIRFDFLYFYRDLCRVCRLTRSFCPWKRSRFFLLLFWWWIYCFMDIYYLRLVYTTSTLYYLLLYCTIGFRHCSKF